MDTRKTVKTYSKKYRQALIKAEIPDVDAETDAFEKRLNEMYLSEDFKKFNIYPSTDAVYVYAKIAMCLGLKAFNMSDTQIIDTINSVFKVRINFFRRLLRCIDLLPNAYQIAKKWNFSDHDSRVKDGSLTYDYFNVTDEKIEYSISRCVYVQMFEQYGIRSLCKIFCMTDTTAYENLSKHVRFVRHSDLSDGTSCHDEVIDKRKVKD